MWLDPKPWETDIHIAYSRYYTHENAPKAACRPASVRALMKLRRWFLPLWSKLSPFHRERERVLLMYLDKVKPGKLLDVGCGDGSRLMRMKALGWDVQGQDLDPNAIVHAQEKLGSGVHLGKLQEIGFLDEQFDCIILNHVIEHVYDPISLLTECRRILRENGILVAVTPNAKSFGHRYFHSSWRGLEPPRHIFLFSPSAARRTAAKAGFNRFRVWTTIANAASFAYGSHMIRNQGSLDMGVMGTFRRRIDIAIYKAKILLKFLVSHDAGEECVIWARR